MICDVRRDIQLPLYLHFFSSLFGGFEYYYVVPPSRQASLPRILARLGGDPTLLQTRRIVHVHRFRDTVIRCEDQPLGPGCEVCLRESLGSSALLLNQDLERPLVGPF